MYAQISDALLNSQTGNGSRHMNANQVGTLEESLGFTSRTQYILA